MVKLEQSKFEKANRVSRDHKKMDHAASRAQEDVNKDIVADFEKICKSIQLEDGDDIPIITEFLEF